MFILQAPYPAISLTTFLPNPQLGDSISPTCSLDKKFAKDGTRYIYVKSRDSRKKMVWTFVLSQAKSLELQAFFDIFNSEQIKITDHLNKIYIGYFTSNPFEFESIRRAVASPGNYSQHQIQVEFEGFQQN